MKRVAAEKEVETSNNMTLLKDQLSEMKSKLSGIEQELANTKNIRKNETGQWKKHLQNKVSYSIAFEWQKYQLDLVNLFIRLSAGVQF